MNTGFLSARTLIMGTISIALVAIAGWSLQLEIVESDSLIGFFNSSPCNKCTNLQQDCVEKSSYLQGGRARCRSDECVCVPCSKGWSVERNNCNICANDSECSGNRTCEGGTCKCTGAGAPSGCCEYFDTDGSKTIEPHELPSMVSGLYESCGITECEWCDSDRELPLSYQSRCRDEVNTICADCSDCAKEGGDCPIQCTQPCSGLNPAPECFEIAPEAYAILGYTCDHVSNTCVSTSCGSDADCLGKTLVGGATCGDCVNGSTRTSCTCNTDGICEAYTERDCDCTTGECNKCKELDDLLATGKYVSSCGPYGETIPNAYWMCEYCLPSGYLPPNPGPVEIDNCFPYPNAEILWPDQCSEPSDPSSSSQPSSVSSTTTSSRSNSASVSTGTTASEAEDGDADDSDGSGDADSDDGVDGSDSDDSDGADSGDSDTDDGATDGDDEGDIDSDDGADDSDGDGDEEDDGDGGEDGISSDANSSDPPDSSSNSNDNPSSSASSNTDDGGSDSSASGDDSADEGSDSSQSLSLAILVFSSSSSISESSSSIEGDDSADGGSSASDEIISSAVTSKSQSSFISSSSSSSSSSPCSSQYSTSLHSSSSSSSSSSSRDACFCDCEPIDPCGSSAIRISSSENIVSSVSSSGSSISSSSLSSCPACNCGGTDSPDGGSDTEDEPPDSEVSQSESVSFSDSSFSCPLSDECSACNDCGAGLFNLCEAHECGNSCTYTPKLFFGGSCVPNPELCDDCTEKEDEDDDSDDTGEGSIPHSSATSSDTGGDDVADEGSGSSRSESEPSSTGVVSSGSSFTSIFISSISSSLDSTSSISSASSSYAQCDYCPACTACNRCGIGLGNLCDEQECLNLGICTFQDGIFSNTCAPDPDICSVCE